VKRMKSLSLPFLFSPSSFPFPLSYPPRRDLLRMTASFNETFLLFSPPFFSPRKPLESLFRHRHYQMLEISINNQMRVRLSSFPSPLLPFSLLLLFFSPLKFDPCPRNLRARRTTERSSNSFGHFLSPLSFPFFSSHAGILTYDSYERTRGGVPHVTAKEEARANSLISPPFPPSFLRFSMHSKHDDSLNFFLQANHPSEVLGQGGNKRKNVYVFFFFFFLPSPPFPPPSSLPSLFPSSRLPLLSTPIRSCIVPNTFYCQCHFVSNGEGKIRK